MVQLTYRSDAGSEGEEELGKTEERVNCTGEGIGFTLYTLSLRGLGGPSGDVR